MDISMKNVQQVSNIMLRCHRQRTSWEQLQRLQRTWGNIIKHRKLKLDAQQSPLPLPLISLDTTQGQELFHRATLCPHTSPISETQRHPAYCGLASAAVILRSFHMPIDQLQVLDPLRQNTPSDFFDTFGLGILDLRFLPASIKYHIARFLIYDGVSMAGLNSLFRLHGLQSTTIYYPQSSITTFREEFQRALSPGSNRRVLVSLHRGKLGQRGMGHFSAIAGYDKQTDRCLLLEVNQKRYPSAWVSVPQLWKALSTETLQGKPRGYLVVQR